MSKIVLGKGLEALIPSDTLPADNKHNFRMLALERLVPNPMQPRRSFSDKGLEELAGSIKSNGLIQPLIVKRSGSSFTIIAGERRFRAARLAELREVPVIVMEEVDDARMLELALVENLQREDLNSLEVAEAYRMLIDRCGLTQNQLSERVGKSRTAVANLLRLLALPESIKLMIRDGRLSEGHGRAILSIESEAEMLKLAGQIVDESLSVRLIEKEVSRKKRGKRLPRRKSPEISEVESWLKQLLGTSVKIVPGLKRGRIEIEYYTEDDLGRLVDLFKMIRN